MELALSREPELEDFGLVSSQLLPLVFEAFEDDDRVVILDVGPGTSSTLNYLSRFRSRVFFTDLFDNDFITNPPEDLDEHTAEQLFQEQLNLPEGTLIDVCLFWDFLHCLDLPIVRGFANALAPYVHGRTTGYSFGVLHGDHQLEHSGYAIQGPDTLIAQACDPIPLKHAHSQQRLADNFDCFSIAKATLLQDGRLEFLLHTD